MINSEDIDWEQGKVSGFSGKSLLASKNGSLKIVKAQPQTKYPEHVHPDKTEYAYVFAGNPTFNVEDELFNSKPNDFITFPKGKKHSIINETDQVCILMIGSIKE